MANETNTDCCDVVKFTNWSVISDEENYAPIASIRKASSEPIYIKRKDDCSYWYHASR
jgi:hypothetical protein